MNDASITTDGLAIDTCVTNLHRSGRVNSDGGHKLYVALMEAKACLCDRFNVDGSSECELDDGSLAIWTNIDNSIGYTGSIIWHTGSIIMLVTDRPAMLEFANGEVSALKFWSGIKTREHVWRTNPGSLLEVLDQLEVTHVIVS